ncbi:molybdopterin cofactor-binding domain-containing protein [uncultured Croceitalea sp.]|uniref:xanthine dehydrogenase family protein molybdopterin-binding subunit n=1 Tax=uncultured Croceitalea sp. TaxID=1798908 RepID=UPI003305ECF2
MKRRHFFRISALGSGSLLVSTFIPLACASEEQEATFWDPNFFIRIDSNNLVTFICSKAELGQGTSTGLAMIMADELGADFDKIKVEFADGSKEKYGRLHLQDTGGSNGIRMVWKPLREAIAITREILIKAASIQLGLPVSSLHTSMGYVHSSKDDQSVAFGDLIAVASTLPAPLEVKLKDPEQFQYIGKPIPGRLTQNASKGIVPYSINVKLPNMVYAVIERCPVWGGSLITYTDSAAREVPGVIDIFEITPTVLQQNDYKGGVRPGVAVVATNTWAAMKAKKLLKIEWDLGPNSKFSSSDVHNGLVRFKESNKSVAANFRNAENILKNSSRKLNANYESPHQANACMEPLNAVAYHYGYKVEVWAGTQSPSMTRERISELTGLQETEVTVNNHPAGGGFGRRFFCDFVEEAVLISERVRLPVKLMWTREDTIKTSKYHPYSLDFWEAAIDDEGMPMALGYQGFTSGPSAYRPFPYGLPIAYRTRLSYKNGWLIPRASWRSVLAHPWALGLESFMDELADSAKKDPLKFRLDLLGNAEIVEQKMDPWVGDDLHPEKLKATLEKVADMSNWFVKTDDGLFQGCSSISYNTSYCSMVANLRRGPNGLYVSKMYAVIDCGLAINPSKVKAQVEGSIIWGLTALLKSSITVKDGMVEQKNFDDYLLLRIDETPEIEVEIMDSNDVPTGSGEPAVPGVAPAVLNALFMATGQRVRKIPLDLGSF